LSATWASLIAWFSGALVSYVLSRWAWKRKGRPNLLKETLPFWVVSAMVVPILGVATKFAYHAAGWMTLHGVERLLFVDLIYGVANLGTFVLRFLFFHYVLFAGSAGRAGPRRGGRGAGVDRPRTRAVRPDRGARGPGPRALTLAPPGAVDDPGEA